MKTKTREEEVINYLPWNTYFIKISLPQFLPKTSRRCPIESNKQESKHKQGKKNCICILFFKCKYIK